MVLFTAIGLVYKFEPNTARSASSGVSAVLRFAIFCTLLSCATCQLAAGLITVNNVSDNTDWSDPRITGGGTQQYDARSITFTGCAGQFVSSLKFDIELTGTYDDSPALDLDGDGTIDWAMSQDDWYAAVGSGPGNYQPWVNASPLAVTVEVTNNGTNILATWNGTAGTPGVGAIPGWNDLSLVTLSDLGFNPDGTVPSASFTTSQIRFGNLNQNGPAGHGSVFILPEDSVIASAPEPSALPLMLTIVAVFLVRRRRTFLVPG